jgi:hypothetical protein
MRPIADDFAAIAAQMPGRPGATIIGTEDPIIALYQRLIATNAADYQLDAPCAALRAKLVDRWGEPGPENDTWHSDPDHSELRRVIAESDRLNCESIDTLHEMMATPATTLAGVLAKMRAAVEIFSQFRELVEWHEEMAFAFMKDAVRLLGEADR